MTIYDKKNIRTFLLLAFGGAWVLQLVSLVGVRIGGMTGQLVYTVCNALCMLTPGFVVALTRGGLKEAKSGIVWKV